MRKRFLGTFVVAALTATLIPLSALSSTASVVGDDGCTPGYWKNHTSNWEEYTTSTKVGNNFQIPSQLSQFQNWTFLQALQGGGGPDLAGAAKILLRAAVAAFLNAAHDGLGYPLQRDQGSPTLRQRINAAFASLDRDTMLALATELDSLNNSDCPLN